MIPKSKYRWFCVYWFPFSFFIIIIYYFMNYFTNLFQLKFFFVCFFFIYVLERGLESSHWEIFCVYKFENKWRHNWKKKSVELSGGCGRLKDSLAHNVLGHLRDLAPLVFREIKASSHDLLAHVLRNGATVVLGVERGVATQHHVDDHAERPQVTALKGRRDKRRRLFETNCKAHVNPMLKVKIP